MKFIQNLGRSLMLPVAVLPAAAILIGIGNMITGFIAEDNVVGIFLTTAGLAIIGHIAVLFAVGVAIGMSREKDGAAALSGLVGFLVITELLGPDAIEAMMGVEEAPAAFAQIENVFIGIISGLVAAWMYNRYAQVQLPNALAFFSGKRLVPIMTAAAMVVLSGVFWIIWPIFYDGLVAFGTAISGLGATGAGLYGFFNRLLIPTGLHHALNAVFWFDTVGIDDLGQFWAGEGELGVTGRYMAGFFPIMMFGLPAAGLAMYHTAKTGQEKDAAGLVLAAGFASFFTGVTEPLEFSFMFLAPVLYVVHAALTGLSLFIAAAFQWTAGFTFSAGFVDYTLSFFTPMANQPYMLLLQGLFFAVLYYFLFRFLILKMNLKTPGREDEENLAAATAGASGGTKDEKTANQAAGIIEGLGGKDNISSLDSCATRLRVEVKDMEQVNEAKIKQAGAAGTNVVGTHNIHVVVGTNVQFVETEVRNQINE
ncbi:N-acetylglucosamine-specific PTS transporter subunit IIBC [Salisediminibacterium halotolerans]|uniref:PTS system, N-acetylglucosamine-specific IIC component n=1 Tax=Salisediminibacterium halotolerans TaxID=517425 RepID=A0A1H9QKV4_9BACI|nr:N-acetylglucosamine-specific PTS transporter subunit IIBC [Salisediminibacterium haloalkalitolerans]SER61146.1 PTS system, N-acetylglucosamine-specific IIC component [Salisediminibacterium haloalkalitolerans]